MAGRQMFVSPDDANYITTFSLSVPLPLDVFLLSEPIWNIYVEFVGSLMDPEQAFRVTIFLANFLFLCFGLAVAKWRFFYVVTVYVFSLYLATLFYFIQIRVGLAIGLFLALVALRVKPLLAGLICAGVHSSFIVVSLSAAFATVFRRSRSGRVAGVSALAILVVLVVVFRDAQDLMSTIDLGRRSAAYVSEGISNVNFYIVSILTFIFSAPYLRSWLSRGDCERPLTSVFLVFFALSMMVSLVHEAGTRLVAMANIFMILNLASGPLIGVSRFFASSTVLFQVLLVVNEFFKGDFGVDSWFFRWLAIIS